MQRTINSQKGSRNNKSKYELLQQREQLKLMVLQKLQEDFGNKSRKHKQRIKDYVDFFFKSNKITEESLRQLRQNIKNLDMNIESNYFNQGNKTNQDINGQRPQTAIIIPNENTKKTVQFDQQNMIENDSDIDDHQRYAQKYLNRNNNQLYAKLQIEDTKNYLQELQNMKIREEQMKQEFKQDLDRQIQEKSRRLQREKDDDLIYAQQRDEYIKYFDQEEKEKEYMKKEQLKQAKQSGYQKIKREKLEKKKELQEQKEKELRVIRQIQEQEQREKEFQLEKKQQYLKQQQEIILSNQKLKEKQIQEEKLSKENEIKQQRELYQLMLERENLRLKQQQDKQEYLRKALQIQEINEDPKIQEKLEGQKLIKYIQEVAERDQQLELQNQQNEKLRKLQLREDLNKQIEYKKKYQQDLSKADNIYKEVFKKDLESYEEFELIKEQKKRLQNLKHQEILKRQIQEKEKRDQEQKDN